MSELLPCPFCGDGARHAGVRDGGRIVCTSPRCFATGPTIFHGPKGWDAVGTDAIAAWNTRAPDPRITQLEADVTVLVEQCQSLLALINRNDVASWLACTDIVEFANAADVVEAAQAALARIQGDASGSGGVS